MIIHTSNTALQELPRLLEVNPAINWRAIALDTPPALDALKWHELPRETMLPLLQAYQRLVRILPVGEERRALRLLEGGLHSEIQIAGLPTNDQQPVRPDIGQSVARSRRRTDTTWTPALTAKYLNAVQAEIAKEMGWKGMRSFTVGDSEVKKSSALMNEV